MEVSVALNLLELAINRVHSSYIKIEACPTSDVKKEQVERSFAYELYHQWSMILSDYMRSEPKAVGMRLNGEITKNMDSYRVFPDIILHGGQDNLKRQILACEIKRTLCGNLALDKIWDDLDILTSYLSMRLTNNGEYIDTGFKGSVFIVVNIECRDLKKKLKETIDRYGRKTDKYDQNEKIKSNAENIYCFSVELENQERVKVSRFKLSEILV